MPLTFLAMMAWGCDGISTDRRTSEYNPKHPPADRQETSATSVTNTEDSASVSLPDTVLKQIGTLPDSADSKYSIAYTDSISEEGTEVSWMDSYPEDDSEAYIQLPRSVEVGRERLLQAIVVRVKSPDLRNRTDSAMMAVEEKLSIRTEAAPSSVIVEKWYSPVNFRGYKFNRKKVLLYGVDPRHTIAVYYYIDSFYISFGDKLYELDETTNYTTFNAVNDTSLAKYLLSYEARL